MSLLFTLTDTGARQYGVNLSTFINFWTPKYYEYSRVPDTIYWQVLNNIGVAPTTATPTAAAPLDLIGAWKTGALSQHHSPASARAFSCNCGSGPSSTGYYFTKRWHPRTPSAFDVWTLQLPKRVKQDQATIASGTDALTLADSIANIAYVCPGAHGGVQKRFGIVYALTYLHFLAPDRVPVLLDKFLKCAVAYLNDITPSTTGTYNRTYHVRNAQDYADFILPRVECIIIALLHTPGWTHPIPVTRRKVDQALWAFGHYLADSRKVRTTTCCQV